MVDFTDGGSIPGSVEGEKTEVTPLPSQLLGDSCEAVPAPVDDDRTAVNEVSGAELLPVPPRLPLPPVVVKPAGFDPPSAGVMGCEDLSGAILQMVGQAPTAPVEVEKYRRSVNPTLVVPTAVPVVDSPMANYPTRRMEIDPSPPVVVDNWQAFAALWSRFLDGIQPGAFTVVATSLACDDAKDSMVVCVNDWALCVQVIAYADFQRYGQQMFPQQLRYAATLLWGQMARQIADGTTRLRVRGQFPERVVCETDSSVHQLPAQMVSLPVQPKPSMLMRLGQFLLPWRWGRK